MTTVLPTDLPTAPLPPAAVEALHRLEAALSSQPEMSAADRLAHELASYVRWPRPTEAAS